jgi:hypothetical protein
MVSSSEDVADAVQHIVAVHQADHLLLNKPAAILLLEVPGNVCRIVAAVAFTVLPQDCAPRTTMLSSADSSTRKRDRVRKVGRVA